MIIDGWDFSKPRNSINVFNFLFLSINYQGVIN